MPSTSTVVVTQYDQDILWGRRLFGSGINSQELDWFARLMPVLRKNLGGMPLNDLWMSVGDTLTEPVEFDLLLKRMWDKDIIWSGAGYKQPFFGNQPVMLTTAFWLKEQLRLQSEPETYVFYHNRTV